MIHNKMNIIIAGGGFCGCLVAKYFQNDKRFNVTLIDEKNYFEYSPGIIKLITNPNYHDKIKKNYNLFLKNVRIIRGIITKITPKTIETKNNKSYNYDFLVISTGIEYPILLDNTNNVFTIKSGDEVKKLNSKIIHANKIIVIGGGLIGVETAGEIVTKYPKKELTIVHKADRLIERNTLKTSNYAKKNLEKHGAGIIFKQKIQKHKENVFITDEKEKNRADLAIWSAGIKFNPFFMKEFSNKIFSEKNALNVNQFLQLKGNSKIFVGGDITSIDEEKTAQNAKRHARIIIKNINRMLKNKKLKSYKIRKIPLVISLGRYNGLFTHQYFTISGFIPAFLKWIVEKFNIYRL